MTKTKPESGYRIRFSFDELVKSQKMPFSVIPVKTGIQEFQAVLDSRLRGSDDMGDFLRVHLVWIIGISVIMCFEFRAWDLEPSQLYGHSQVYLTWPGGPGLPDCT
jgi:hypothetical protein